MKIGLTGDTHNNLKNVAKICDIFNAHDLDFVIHTGDISLPKTLLAFDILKMPLMGVFGNNVNNKCFARGCPKKVHKISSENGGEVFA